MGLDTSHNAWHGSYSNFNRFRTYLYEKLDLGSIDDYYGFGGLKKLPESLKLAPLLEHSDCDGKLTVNECQQVAEGLEELLPKLTDEWQANRAKQFIEGCLDAVSKNEEIEFY